MAAPIATVMARCQGRPARPTVDVPEMTAALCLIAPNVGPSGQPIAPPNFRAAAS